MTERGVLYSWVMVVLGRTIHEFAWARAERGRGLVDAKAPPWHDNTLSCLLASALRFP
jgi:hypothetical protein